MNSGSKGSGSSTGTGRLGQYPVAYSFGLMVLAALILLAVLRHLTGTISIQAGTR